MVCGGVACQVTAGQADDTDTPIPESPERSFSPAQALGFWWSRDPNDPIPKSGRQEILFPTGQGVKPEPTSPGDQQTTVWMLLASQITFSGCVKEPHPSFSGHLWSLYKLAALSSLYPCVSQEWHTGGTRVCDKLRAPHTVTYTAQRTQAWHSTPGYGTLGRARLLLTLCFLLLNGCNKVSCALWAAVRFESIQLSPQAPRKSKV